MSPGAIVRTGSVPRAAALLSRIGGAVLLRPDDQVTAALTLRVSVGVLLKIFATYAALFGAAVWTATAAEHQEPARVRLDRP